MLSRVRSPQLIAGLIFGLWLVLFSALSYWHVPWRDEAQAWLVATRTQSLGEFFEAIRYERHPPLYYILLRLYSFFTDAHWSVLSRGLTVLSAGFIFFFARGPFSLRALIPFGILFLLEYGVMARCYSCGLFFLLLAAHFNPASSSNPKRRSGAFLSALLLSASTHLFFTLLAGSIFVFYLKQMRPFRKISRRDRLQLSLSAIGFALLLLFQTPPQDSTFATGITPSLFSIKRVLEVLGYGWTGLNQIANPFSWNYNFWGHPVYVFGVPALIYFLWKDRFPLRLYFWLALGPLLTMCLIYTPALRHAGILSVAIYFILFSNIAKFKHRTLYFFAFCQVFTTLSWIYTWNPVNGGSTIDFSGSGDLISNFGSSLQSGVVLSSQDSTPLLFPVMAELNISTWQVEQDDWYHYPKFKRRALKHTADSWCGENRTHLHQKFHGKSPILYVVKRDDAPPSSCQPYRMIFRNSKPVFSDETYSVYQFD